MERKTWLLPLVAAAALAAIATTTQAAPFNNGAASRADAFPIDTVAMHCWWSNGRRHCAYGYRYREHGYPENYRTGSRRWWNEMDRENRGGRGRN